MNAVGEEPWQLFSLDLKNKKTSKVTTDKVGKFNGKAGKDNVIYFGVLDKSSIISKIEKLNTKDNSSLIFDRLDKDRDPQVYDVRNDKVVAVMVSNSEENKRQEEANKTKKAKTNLKPIDYTIYEMNSDDTNMKRIASVNAYRIDSISYNYDCKKVIITGKDINNENGQGIYEISTENGQVTKLLTNPMIQSDKNSTISEVGRSSAVLSKDGHTLYFGGVPKGASELKFLDVTSMPQNVYSYDLTTNNIKDVAEIAAAFLVPETTMAQRMTRSKQKIKVAGIPYRIPRAEDLPARLAAVLAVLYLIFNEGYLGSSGEAQRSELTAEAIRLTRQLREMVTGHARPRTPPGGRRTARADAADRGPGAGARAATASWCRSTSRTARGGTPP